MNETSPDQVKELETEKLRLIERYMAMQDEADAINDRIYGLCCEIEALNQKIVMARREAELKAALNPPKNGNGRHAP